MRSLIASSAFALTALAHAAPCSADPSAADRTVAETLFKDAKKLMARGKIPEACEKFASSYKIDPVGGTLLNLAMCHEVEGRTATAWTEFNEALSLAKKSGRVDRQKAATEHIAALEPRLSRLTITPPAGAPAGLEIKIDGDAIAAAAIGTAIPVDPGDHIVVASAPRKKPWEAKVALREGKPQSITVPALADLEATAPVTTSSGAAWQLPTGIVGLGAGAALLAVGTGFGVHAVALGGRVRAACPGNACSAEGLAALDDGRAAARVSNGTLIAGGALAVAGAALVVIAITSRPPSGAPPSASFELSPAWIPGHASLSARGAF